MVCPVPHRYAMAVMNHHVCPVENWWVIFLFWAEEMGIKLTLVAHIFNFLKNLGYWGNELNSLCHCCRSYNVTCTEELPRPGFPKTCCTIQDIPLIRSPVLLLLLTALQGFVSAEYKSNFVSAKAQRHELAPCYVVALWQSLTHALHKLHLFNLQISL